MERYFRSHDLQWNFFSVIFVTSIKYKIVFFNFFFLLSCFDRRDIWRRKVFKHEDREQQQQRQQIIPS